MALYSVSIGNREYRVNLSGRQELVDGKPVSDSLIPLNTAGLHLLRRGQQALELVLNSQDNETLEVLIGSKRLIARVESLQKRLRRKTEDRSAGSLMAPMPGLVIKVLVKQGETVERGQTLVVLESMKMQMQLRAAIDGVVAAIAVEDGKQVEKGTLLVKVEAPAE